MSITRVRHTGIVVSEMTKSLRFYKDLLGLEVWADFQDASPYAATVTGVRDAKIWMIKLKACDGVSIELLQYLSHPQPTAPPRRPCDAGINHVALQVEDIDALHESLLSHKIEFISAPIVSSDGGAKVAYCRDPEGVIVELVQLAPAGGFPQEASR